MKMFKKILCCALLLCMFAATAFATAEPVLLQTMEGNYWRFLPESNFLIKRVNNDDSNDQNNLYLYDTEMNLIAGPYGGFEDQGDGCLAVMKRTEDGRKLYGVLNYDGTVRIPPEYEYIACKNGYVNAQVGYKKTKRIDPEGNELGIFDEDVLNFEYLPKDRERPSVGRERNSDTGLYALTDSEGNLLTDYAFDFIMDRDFTDYGYSKVSNKDGKTGMLSITGELVVPMEYEEILFITEHYDQYETCGIFAAVREDILAFAQNGTVTEINIGNPDHIFFYGPCALVVYADKSTAIAWPDGRLQKVDADYCEAFMVNGEPYFVVTEHKGRTDTETLYDKDMNMVMQVNNDVIFVSRDGYVLVTGYDGNQLYELR